MTDTNRQDTLAEKAGRTLGSWNDRKFGSADGRCDRCREAVLAT